MLLGLAILNGFQVKNEGRCGMGSAQRRMEIISILSARGHATMRELAWEFCDYFEWEADKGV